MAAAPEIRLVIFDWAGTTVDFGCFAPVAGFVDAFAGRGVAVSAAQARGPMGLHKRDHILGILRHPEVDESWRRVHGRAWTDRDVDGLYEAFVPLQLAVLDRHSRLVPGVPEAVKLLRERGIRIGGTTGYFRSAVDRVAAAARAQGYAPDHNVGAEDVPAGRPAPWMIHRNMEALGIFPPRSVLKVGDTVPDIGEGRNAGVWSVGVIDSSSEIGLTEAEFAALSSDEREARRDAVRKRFEAAGAHAVVHSVAEVPALVEIINARMRRGESPSW